MKAAALALLLAAALAVGCGDSDGAPPAPTPTITVTPTATPRPGPVGGEERPVNVIIPTTYDAATRFPRRFNPERAGMVIRQNRDKGRWKDR